jgi:ABC-type lipoprotein release transport system permease subunit
MPHPTGLLPPSDFKRIKAVKEYRFEPAEFQGKPASKVVARVLYGIAPYDWVTFTGMPCFLAVVALIACWLPAHRAAAVEPQTVLRHE